MECGIEIHLMVTSYIGYFLSLLSLSELKPVNKQIDIETDRVTHKHALTHE